ncbi:MAG: hypothetical protein A2W28_01980 [Gammaproteobacteria bacterium RBG_16_51_14]|nr:MAG: hypothetical protein A2W28_01980 [Gammaproteobacteria bacterium RBG_16_51_14]
MNTAALEQIRNYYRMDGHIATAGQPTVDQFHAIKRADFDLVINLALPDSPGAIPDEGDLVRLLGMDYIHIPVDFGAPTFTDLHAFFATVDQHQDKKIFIHCAYNWRVSVFIYLYKRIRQQVAASDALPVLHAVWEPDDTWHRFIQTALAHYHIQD